MAQLLGVGIYSQPEAARLLRITPSRLRRWVNGYTYWLSRETAEVKRDRPPVLHKSDLPVLGGSVALSFLELMELRVIKILVDDFKVPLQTVRKTAHVARTEFGTRYPFATRTVFAKGQRVFASVDRVDPSVVIELKPGRTMQVQWARLYEPVMREVQFDSTTSFAQSWWPLGVTRPIVLNPAVKFGAPVISGSRVTTSAVATMAALEGESAVAAAYRVSPEGVEAALEFEHYLAAA